MSENNQKMTLKDYYDQLEPMSPRVEFKYNVIKECGISPATFYNWLNGISDVPKTSKERISHICGIPVDDLFPVTVSE